MKWQLLHSLCSNSPVTSVPRANAFSNSAAFAATSIPDLANDGEAMKAGERLFSNYCSQCHGSDAGGSRGFPNLTDGAWLWGGTPEQIKEGAFAFNCHRFFMENPSLSGRGSAGAKDVPELTHSEE